MLATKITLQEKLDMINRSLASYPNEDTFYLKLYKHGESNLFAQEVKTKLELLDNLEVLAAEGESCSFDCITVWKIEEIDNLHSDKLEAGNTTLSTLINCGTNSAELLGNFNRELIVVGLTDGKLQMVRNSLTLKELVKITEVNGSIEDGTVHFKECTKVFKVVKQLF